MVHESDVGRARAVVWAGGLIVLSIALAYLPVLHGGFVWDDDSWTIRIVDLLRDISGLRTIWLQPTAMQQYYPLSGTTFWLDYQLWKFWPLPYHVENVLLHASAALLFWRSLRRLQVPGAWLASALFALHPVMVESVAWITERKNVLSLTLCLGAFLAYLSYTGDESQDDGRPVEAPAMGARAPLATGYAPLGRDEPHRQRRGVCYVLALLLFLAALLAKTSVCAFPAVILLLAWWRRGQLRWRRDVLPTLPFFVLALGMCAVTAWLEKNHVGARGPDYALTIPQRFLIAGRAFWFYLGKLVWPANLCFVYPRWQPNAGEWREWLYPVTAVGMLVTLWLARTRIGRGPVTALLFFVGTLSPILGFVNVYYMRYSFVCDHWVYLPSLGPIALAASGLSKILKYRDGSQSPKSPIGAVLLLALGALTWRQAAMYTDLESLWRITLSRNPDCWIAYSSLGNALFRRGKTDEAIENFEEAIRLKPDLAEAYTSLGAALGSKGQLDEAIGKLEQAIRINPDYAEAHYDLAIALQRQGESDEAIRQFQEATRLKLGFAAAQHPAR